VPGGERTEEVYGWFNGSPGKEEKKIGVKTTKTCTSLQQRVRTLGGGPNRKVSRKGKVKETRRTYCGQGSSRRSPPRRAGQLGGGNVLAGKEKRGEIKIHTFVVSQKRKMIDLSRYGRQEKVKNYRATPTEYEKSSAKV